MQVTVPATTRQRIQSLDLLRGAVMVIMAIDHIRDFLHYDAQHYSPEDLTQTSAAIFFTRWITHFCAPVFVFSAGTGAFLSLGSPAAASVVSGFSRTSLKRTARFLLTRGLWLIVVEMTLINWGWAYNFSYAVIVWQVIWAIGWSMIALAALIYLPWRALLAVSLAMIAFHNLLDGVRPEQFGSFAWLWDVLHVGPSPIQLSDNHLLLVIYPLIPWIGVMSAGFCFGRVMRMEAAERKRTLLMLGAALTIGFVVIRALNGYGDPSAWSRQPSGTFTLLSFLNATKYPPSLDFLLMTLGPAIFVLGLLDRASVSDRNPLLVFGRVPLFYYIIHWYTLHAVALVMAWIRYGRFDFMFGPPPSLLPFNNPYPADYGYSLGVIYVVWAAVVVALYPVCLWFARLKARNRSPWLSYL